MIKQVAAFEYPDVRLAGRVLLCGFRHSCQFQLASIRSESQHRRNCVMVRAAAPGDFTEGIKKLGKSIQAGLPIVGLISRLTAPEGGFDDLTYPEFCRAQLEAGSNRLNFAIADLEAAHGQQAGRRAVLLYAWMIKQGCGVLPDEFFVLSARRLNASMDVEAEMNRFEQALEVEKRQYLEQADVDAVREVSVAVDALSTCCLGLRDPQAIADSDKPLILDILAVIFEQVDEAVIQGCMDSKTSRAYVG